MFGKKILSIVGLIFLGSQLAFVNAKCNIYYDEGNKRCFFDIDGPECDYMFKKNMYILATDPTGSGKYVVEIDENGSCNLADKSDDFCVTNTGEVVDRIVGFCNDVCDQKVTCTNGVCEDLKHSCTRNVPEPCNPKNAPGECEAGYYILTKIDDTLLTAGGEGELYSCGTKGSCNQIVTSSYPTGYLKNADSTNAATIPYIQCTKGGSCVGLSASDLNENTEAKAGDLVMDNSTPKLIITSGISVGIVDNDEYFICNEEGISNVFTGMIPRDFCGIVEMTTTDIILKDRVVGSDIPKYVYTNVEQKIYRVKSDDICLSPNRITEFILDYCVDKPDVTDLYIKGETSLGPITPQP